MNQEALRVLYMQIRHDPITREEEFDEFIRYSGLKRSQFTLLNVFDTPHFGLDLLAQHDTVFVGGSSDTSVLGPDPFLPDAKALLLACIDRSMPVFASCFGFQLAVEALGGQVIVDKANLEMGTYQIVLTEAAQSDLLLKDTPNLFWAVSGHQERALRLPEEVIPLAYTERCPYHAFKVIGKPFYGFQFHPEVDHIDLVNRITRYQEKYLEDDDHLDRIKASAQPTPESNALVRKFVERILLNDPPL